MNKRTLIAIFAVLGVSLGLALLLNLITLNSPKTVAMQSKPELFPQLGHSDEVLKVAISPDNKQLVSAGFDGTIIVWDVESGREIRVLTGHTTSVQSVAYSYDGKLLASGDADGTIRLWDVAAGRMLHMLQSHSNDVQYLSFSKDAQLLASSSADGTLILWNSESAKAIRILKNGSMHDSGASPLAFTPDAKGLISSDQAGELVQWDVESGNRVRVFQAIHGQYEHIGFLSDGTLLVQESAFEEPQVLAGQGSYQEIVSFWNVATGQELRSMRKTPTSDAETSIISTDGTLVASTADVGRAIEAEKPFGSVKWKTPNDATQAMSLDISSDKAFVASANFDGTVTIWDARNGHALRKLSGKTSSLGVVALSRSGKRFAAVDEKGTIALWDLSTGHRFRVATGGTIAAIAYSHDDAKIGVASDGRLDILGPKPKKVIVG